MSRQTNRVKAIVDWHDVFNEHPTAILIHKKSAKLASHQKIVALDKNQFPEWVVVKSDDNYIKVECPIDSDGEYDTRFCKCYNVRPVIKWEYKK